jgi:hypothetical protein
MGYLSSFGSEVDGGVIHLINGGFEGNTSLFYTVPFTSTIPGVPGRLSEIIGCYAWTGVNDTLVNPANPVNAWGNFGINNLVSHPVFTVTPPQLVFNPMAANQTVALTWTNNMGAFNLYSASSLATPAAWAPVTTTPYFSSNRWTVVDSSADSAQRFYRLSQ